MRMRCGIDANEMNGPCYECDALHQSWSTRSQIFSSINPRTSKRPVPLFRHTAFASTLSSEPSVIVALLEHIQRLQPGAQGLL